MPLTFTPGRAPRPFVALLPLLLLLSLSLSSCRTDAFDVVGEDRLLEKLMEEYISARFDFYPVEATLAGLPGNDDRLGDFSRAEIDRRTRFLTDYRHKLTGLKPTSLSDPAHMDLLWLTSLVKAELFELEERASWRQTASFYGETIRVGIISLLLSGDLSGRTGSLAGRLDDVSRLVDDAKENLAGAEARSALWIDDGVASLERSRALLSDLPLLLEPSLPSYRVADLAERSRLAVRALQSLITMLRTRAREGGSGVEEEPSYVLGEDGLERFWLYREMIDRPLAELVATAEAAVDSETHALTELALENYAGNSLRRLLGARGDGSQPIPGDEDALSALADEVRSALGLRESFALRRVPWTFLDEPVRLWRPAALEPGRDPVLLVSAQAPVPGVAEFRLLTLVELSSRLPQFAFQARSASLLRRVMASQTASEGFRSWHSGHRLAAGLETEDPGLFLRYRRRVLLENVRLLAVLSIHGSNMDLAQAEQLFTERGFLSPRESRAEARRAALDPSVASAALGRLLLDELARDYRHAFPLSDEDEIVTKILEEALVPVRLLRSRILGLEDLDSVSRASSGASGP